MTITQVEMEEILISRIQYIRVNKIIRVYTLYTTITTTTTTTTTNTTYYYYYMIHETYYFYKYSNILYNVKYNIW